jgi:alanyl-tRNA synthetase
MTERIYYSDPYCRSFDAQVARVFQHDGRPAVTLNRTAFYPTSGGQPFDTGRLGGTGVVDVVDLGDEIAHLLATPEAFEIGATVSGEVDWPRRFDHMQQHTGQHVLSAAFARTCEDATVSFHMGADESTIDLAREASPAEIERAVDEANRVVWEDRAVSIRIVSGAEAETLPLRKEPAREGPLRLIDIADVDLSACGGAHVARTGAIGLIAVLGAEKFRGGMRVTFVCGARALRALRTYRDAVAGSTRVLSVLPGELPSAVERVQNEARDLRKTIKGLQERLATHEAARLRSTGTDVAGVRVVVSMLDGWDAAGLKAIAAEIVAGGNAAVALVSSSSPVLVVAARSPGVLIDANAALKELISRFGGRGGGKPDLAQGGGLTAGPEDIASAARTLIESSLRT